VEEVLARAEERLGGETVDSEARSELAEARLNLAQAELARRSLARLLPRGLVLALVLSVVLVGIAATVLGRQLSRPLAEVVQGMARYAQGHLDHRIPEGNGKPDEMQFLVRQFNRMGDDLAAQRARLEVTESLAAWQGVARNLAHELKNPLTAMRLAVGRLERLVAGSGDDGARQRESLGLLAREIDSLLRLAQSFSAFARLPTPELRTCDLTSVVADVCALYQEQSAANIEVTLEPGLAVQADPELLKRALGNLLKNALEASEGETRPVCVTAGSKGDLVQIQIDDEGVGIAEALQGARLSRSLGTTKSEGSGLGLPLAHRILHEHGGSLSLAPRVQGGTRATVLLQRAEATHIVPATPKIEEA
jgi:nitrogen fixation/metabolism regulation signal transduction histidine kinase